MSRLALTGVSELEFMVDEEPKFFEIGERKLKGLEAPERLYAVYPKKFINRHVFNSSMASVKLATPRVQTQASKCTQNLILPSLTPNCSTSITVAHFFSTGDYH